MFHGSHTQIYASLGVHFKNKATSHQSPFLAYLPYMDISYLFFFLTSFIYFLPVGSSRNLSKVKKGYVRQKTHTCHIATNQIMCIHHTFKGGFDVDSTLFSHYPINSDLSSKRLTFSSHYIV